jgi:hypothetical protein
VVVDGDGQALLRLFLADDVLVEDVLDLEWRRDVGEATGGLALLLFRQDFVAERYALVADVSVRR